MKILILGGSGFVGNYIQNYLSSYYNVFSTSRNGKGVDFVLDIKNLSTYFIFEQNFDVVINCIVDYESDIHEKISIETLHKSYFLNFLSGKCKHYIDISSISALRQNRNLSDYNFAKFLSEEVTMYVCKKRKIKYSILRFAQIFDTYGNGRDSQKAFYYFVDSFRKKQEINVFGNADCKRSYMPMEVLLMAVGMTITNEITGNHNIIMPDTYSSNELIREFKKVIDFPDENINYMPNKLASEYYIPKCSIAFSEFVLKCPKCPKYFSEIFKNEI